MDRPGPGKAAPVWRHYADHLEQRCDQLTELLDECREQGRKRIDELAALRQLPEKWQRQRSSRITPDYEGDVWAALNKEGE